MWECQIESIGQCIFSKDVEAALISSLSIVFHFDLSSSNSNFEMLVHCKILQTMERNVAFDDTLLLRFSPQILSFSDKVYNYSQCLSSYMSKRIPFLSFQGFSGSQCAQRKQHNVESFWNQYLEIITWQVASIRKVFSQEQL